MCYVTKNFSFLEYYKRHRISDSIFWCVYESVWLVSVSLFSKRFQLWEFTKFQSIHNRKCINQMPFHINSKYFCTFVFHIRNGWHTGKGSTSQHGHHIAAQIQFIAEAQFVRWFLDATIWNELVVGCVVVLFAIAVDCVNNAWRMVDACLHDCYRPEFKCRFIFVRALSKILAKKTQRRLHDLYNDEYGLPDGYRNGIFLPGKIEEVFMI